MFAPHHCFKRTSKEWTRAITGVPSVTYQYQGIHLVCGVYVPWREQTAWSDYIRCAQKIKRYCSRSDIQMLLQVIFGRLVELARCFLWFFFCCHVCCLVFFFILFRNILCCLILIKWETFDVVWIWSMEWCMILPVPFFWNDNYHFK